MLRPATCSRIRYGCAVDVTPASISPAMCGCARRARIVPSRRNRSSPARPISAMLSSLTATRPSKRPSQRSASQTEPIPPCPMGDTRRYAPIVSPASDCFWAARATGATGCSRKRDSWIRSCSTRSFCNSTARPASRAKMDSSHAPRPRVGISSASSRYGLSARQRSALSGMRFQVGRTCVANRVVQVQPALLPLALNGPLGHTSHDGDLRERQAAEELQLDDLGELRLDLRQLVERIVDSQERLPIGDALLVERAQCGDLEQPSPLLRPMPPHVVDDEPSHDTRGIAHEPCVIDEPDVPLGGDPQIRLV